MALPEIGPERSAVSAHVSGKQMAQNEEPDGVHQTSDRGKDVNQRFRRLHRPVLVRTPKISERL